MDTTQHFSLKRTGLAPLKFNGRLLVTQRFQFESHYLDAKGIHRFKDFLEFGLYQTDDGGFIQTTSTRDTDGFREPTRVLHVATVLDRPKAKEMLDAFRLLYSMDFMKPDPIQGGLITAMQALTHSDTKGEQPCTK